LSHFYFADAIQPPTRAELDEAHANGDHGDHDEGVEGVTGTVELEKS
jgi:ubiquinol-cytochrome c reductase cytochrome b subunit